MARVFILALAVHCTALVTATANVTLAPLFGSHMVLQRGKTVPVFGTASPNKLITVVFNGQTTTATSDTQGNWQVTLDAMVAKTTGDSLTATEAEANTLTMSDVVVGDVWICSGQSNMDWILGGCNRQVDINSANFPGLRQFYVPIATAANPTKNLSGSWTVCSPGTAGNFTAVGFYFARKIYQDQGSTIPIGLIKSAVGGTCIDPWLAPEGGLDIPVLLPLYSQSVLSWGPFCLFNDMIYPLAPLPVKGAIWYQGENGETTNQSPDSYYLKEKALIQGWQRLWGMDEFPFYIVQIANWLDPAVSATPEVGGWPLIREFQTKALAIPHTGVAVTIDLGEAGDIHPKDKLDVGERLALWALKNDYGRSIIPSGPILKDVTVDGSTLVCSFDYIGAGLMVGSKTPYLPTTEVVGGTLRRFSIAGSTGTWYAANATISGNTVIVSSPSVTTPKKVAYAYWINPSGANLYNRDGLPASPFCVEDVTAKYTVTASSGMGGSISPTGTTTFLRRMTALYAITPDADYFIQDVKVDNVSIGAVRYFSFDPLYANHTIDATFVATTAPNYTVTASNTSYGTISPSGILTVPQGGAQSFKIVPNANCQIVSVTVDGINIGKRTDFTFGDIRANHSIAASFEHIPCKITATAGSGGSISPHGIVLIVYGADQTFNIAPNSGYAISNVKVDGVNVGAISTYTFTSVTANHTILATFRLLGSISVTIDPLAVRDFGRWRLTSGPDTTWKPHGQIVKNIEPGDYTLEFDSISGQGNWVTPDPTPIGIVTGMNSFTAVYRYRVGTGQTIQAAIDSASSGATILVPPKVYHERIVIDHSMSLKAIDTISKPVIHGGGEGKPIFINSLSTAINVAIFGLEITGSGDGNSDGLGNGGIVAYVHSDSTLLLENSVVRQNKGNGITAMGAFRINNCIIDHNAGTGLFVTSQCRARVLNCTLVSNGARGLFASPDAGSLLAVNNIIAYNALGLLSQCPADTHHTCHWSNGDGNQVWGQGDIVLDPLFVNKDDQNFHLMANSPCIDAATSTDVPNIDIDGQSRPYGAAFDMGAYEYSPTLFFRRGDVDGNGERQITDPITLLGFLFLGEAAPSCLDAADTNDDGELDLSDAIGLLFHLFQGVQPLPAPFPGCGIDPTTSDGLDCVAFTGCP